MCSDSSHSESGSYFISIRNLGWRQRLADAAATGTQEVDQDVRDQEGMTRTERRGRKHKAI